MCLGFTAFSREYLHYVSLQYQQRATHGPHTSVELSLVMEENPFPTITWAPQLILMSASPQTKQASMSHLLQEQCKL